MNEDDELDLDELDEHGIPKHLEQRAVRDLGRFLVSVAAFVERVNAIPWMIRAGQAEPWDDSVERVWSFDDAKRLRREFIRVPNSVFISLGEIGKAFGRFEVMEAAEDYWIAPRSLRRRSVLPG